jgi:four helix bundle protein
MANVNTFRELIAWQRAMELAKAIYASTRSMPKEEQFGLTNQMRRSAVSVPSNIVEGFGRQSRPDLIKFLRTARGSLNELSTQFELAISLQLIQPQPTIWSLVEETDRVLQGLIRSLERKR